MTKKEQLRLIEKHQVPESVQRTRLSDYATGIFESIRSKNGIKKALKNGLIKVNGKKVFSANFIEGGELIELFQGNVSDHKPIINLPIKVLYEDDYLAIVNKPAGIIVSGNKKITLENALPNSLKVSNKKGALPRPEPIHRLDYATSGVLIIGKTTNMVTALNQLFEKRKVKKRYYAITIGKMNNNGTITSPVENKASESVFKVVSSIESPKYKYLNLVELIPNTGRRNQLRIHMAEMGNPILGDQKFGKEGLILKGKGLYLHSYSLEFTHPVKNELLTITASVPKKFLKLFPESLNKP